MPLTPEQQAIVDATGPAQTTTSALSSPTTANAPPTTIRNISQTVQEREIIKIAPDLAVYLEGFPYLVNNFISDPETNNPYTVVGFNDYVTSFNAGYDTENLIPAASIQLTVPNHVKHLFQMPGGNNLIQSMMAVQVFAKGYYFGNDGSTLFRRVFKGIVSHISMADDGKMLSIQVQCNGTLRMLELMQVELAPAVISNSPMGTVPTKTNLAYCNPYLMIVDMFLRRISTEGYYIGTVNQNNPAFGAEIKNSSDAYNQAVLAGFVPKWQSILDGLKKDVHFYGVTYKEPALNDPTKLTNLSLVYETQDDNKKGAANDKIPSLNETQQLGALALTQIAPLPTVATGTVQTTAPSSNAPFPAIRQYLPDMEIASIQLLNGKIVNRLDEVRQVLHAILYEGYQDVDGKIIFKPPLYNLDVANDNIGTATTTVPAANSGGAGATLPNSSTSNGGASQANSATEITAANNPFVIYLSEIITEQETEDEAAVRVTRMTVRGNWEPSFQFAGSEDYLLETVEYIDIPKLQKFGLRETPTQSVGWFRDGDKYGLFAYAVSETIRANRGYRTYTCTIPMRPELKLGFPVFLPHRDMYGYVKSIQLQYNQGGAATMTVTLDALRRRPLLPTQSTTAQGSPITVFASQPDLVYQWTSAPVPPTSGQSPSTTVSSTYPQGSSFALGSSPSSSFTALSTSSSNSCLVQPAPNSPANLVGLPATVQTTPDQALNPQQQAVLKTQQTRLGTSMGIEPDSATACFRVQNDVFAPYQMPLSVTQTAGSVPTLSAPQGSYSTNANGGGVFKKQRVVDSAYYHDIRRTMPFTDGKGYEVVAPFPWGRYITLRQAFKEFTQDGYVVNPLLVGPDSYVPSDQVQALLAAGLVTPTGQGETVDQLLTQMSKTAISSDTTIIVLSYSGQNTVSDSALMTTAQPDVNSAIQQLQNTITTQNQAIAVLVSGGVSPTQATADALASITTPNPTANIGLTSSPSSPPKDLYPTTNQQGIK
jgi:hypothetical protein